MKITDIRKTAPIAQWHSTIDIFGELSPQPEVLIKPLRWEQRNHLTDAATTIKMIPHPDKPGDYLPHKQVDGATLVRGFVAIALVGLKHFEAEDGRELNAERPADIDLLLDVMPAEFTLWLQKLIVRVSDEADEVQKTRQEAAAKN